MGMLERRNPPSLPLATQEYDRQYMNQLLGTLRIFFDQLNAVQQLSVSGLNVDVDTVPTSATYANLRVGDMYLDPLDNTLKLRASATGPAIPVAGTAADKSLRVLLWLSM